MVSVDIFTGLLPLLPGIPFGAALIVVFRLYLQAVKELREERADHAKTQQEFDKERDLRRQLQDDAKPTRPARRPRSQGP